METKIKKEIILFLVLSLFFISLIYAVPDFGSIPPIPDHFLGNVLVDSQNATIGTIVSVYVGSTLELVYNVTESGRYDLYVRSGETNDLIEFKILGKRAGNSTRQGGKTINLDLEISTETETAPPSSPPSSSGGSSGGGGGSSGGGGGSSSRISPSSSTTSNEQVNNSIETNETKDVEKEIQTLKITGAVIGFINKPVGKIVLVLVVLGIGVMIIKFKPLRRWRKN